MYDDCKPIIELLNRLPFRDAGNLALLIIIAWLLSVLPGCDAPPPAHGVQTNCPLCGKLSRLVRYDHRAETAAYECGTHEMLVKKKQLQNPSGPSPSQEQTQ